MIAVARRVARLNIVSIVVFAAIVAVGLVVAMATSSGLWVGESGIVTALVLVAAAVILSRGKWTVIRSLPEPGQLPVQQTGIHAQPRVQ